MLYLSKYTKELSKLFLSSENILLICHINPDGDAIGSQLALYHYLISIGKKVSMLSPNYLQEFLKWMSGSDLINIFIKERRKCRSVIENADLIVLLDFNQTDRMGEAEQLVLGSRARKVIIDHHQNPQGFADLLISEPTMCSTAELVYELVEDMSKQGFMNEQFAEAVYVGIITDTGNFNHGNYTPRTFRIVAELMEHGIDKEKVYDLIYNNFSADRTKLMGFALDNRMVVLPEYKTAYIYLSKDDLKTYNHVKGDTEGFVNIPLSIKDIWFSAFFMEKDGFVKLSFRSKGKFSTNEFASSYFNGGGHINASGGEHSDTLENTISYFLKVLKENAWRFEDI